MLAFVLVETLNGNHVVKPIEKAKPTDMVEIELYATNLEDAKRLAKKHLKEMKC